MANKKVCKNCGNVLKGECKYCPVCGVKIEKETDENKNVKCKECGTEFNIESEFCSDRGKKLIDDKSSKDENFKQSKNSHKENNESNKKSVENNDNIISKSKKTYLRKKVIIIIAVISLFTIICSAVVLMFFGIIDGSYVGIVNASKSQSVIENYIEAKEYDKAGNYAVMVQKKRAKNDELLLMLADEIKNIAPKQTFEMIKNYYDKTKSSDRNEEIERMYLSAKSYPVLPEVTPVSGTYIDNPNVSFSFKDNRVGHSIYYTLDGSNPSETSNLYINPFCADSDCVLKIMAVNAIGEKSNVGIYEYKTDNTKKADIEKLYNKAKGICEKAIAGDEIGQCLYGAKNNMELLLAKIEKRMKEGNISCIEADGMYSELNNKLFALNSSILVSCDKSKLKEALDNAKAVLNKSKENSLAYAVKSNIDNLENKIGDCQTLYELRNTTQEKADEMQKEIEKLTSVLEENLQTAMLNESYKKFIGKYYGYDGDSDYYRNTYIEITKINNGCVWGNITVGAYEDFGYNYKMVEGAGNFNGVKISGGKLSVAVKGNSTIYDSYDYKAIREDEYTANVTLSFNVNKDELKFYISNIGGGKDWTGRLEKY